jgi:hypothetical protein
LPQRADAVVDRSITTLLVCNVHMFDPENLTLLGDAIHLLPLAAAHIPYVSPAKVWLEKKEKLEFLSAKALRLQFRLNMVPSQLWNERFKRESGIASAYLDQDVLILRSKEDEVLRDLEEIKRLIERVNDFCATEWTRLRPLVEAEESKRQLHKDRESA